MHHQTTHTTRRRDEKKDEIRFLSLLKAGNLIHCMLNENKLKLENPERSSLRDSAMPHCQTGWLTSLVVFTIWRSEQLQCPLPTGRLRVPLFNDSPHSGDPILNISS